MSPSASLVAVQCCMWLVIALPSTQGKHSCHCAMFHALWCQQDHPSAPNPWDDTRTACNLICLLSNRHCLPYSTKPFGGAFLRQLSKDHTGSEQPAANWQPHPSQKARPTLCPHGDVITEVTECAGACQMAFLEAQYSWWVWPFSEVPGSTRLDKRSSLNKGRDVDWGLCSSCFCCCGPVPLEKAT